MYLNRDGSRLCRSNRSDVFFGHSLRRVPFLHEKEAAVMDINYFKDVLFDLMNESDALDVEDIQSDDKENQFVVTVRGGATFSVQITPLDK